MPRFRPICAPAGYEVGQVQEAPPASDVDRLFFTNILRSMTVVYLRHTRAGCAIDPMHGI